MPRPTGRGRYEWRPNPRSLLLFNFDIGGDGLKPEHEEILRRDIVPALRRGGSVSIVGLASRTSTDARNQALSEQRAQRTLAFLRDEVRTGFRARQVVGFGERAAAREGYRDETEDERFRSVVLFLAAGPSPPPHVPPVIDVTPALPGVPAVPEHDPLMTVVEVLEFTGGATGLLELVARQALATVLTSVGAVAHGVVAVLALPLAWRRLDALCKFNGACFGFWNAMQDMADAFGNPALDTIPEIRWPAVPVPRPHPLPQNLPAGSPEQQAWQQGNREGCRLAYDTIMGMEQRPVTYTAMIGGRRRTIRLTGRMYLRLMRRAFPDRGGVADSVRDEINRRLRAQGQREWPLFGWE